MRQLTSTTFAVLMLLFCTAFTGLEANNTTKNFASVEDYIQQHKDYAVSEMHRMRVPASITLAQAILESSFGNSYLAVHANNHFGIKCHEWVGDKVYKDDDAKNECFRSYGSVYESFVDHSEFLGKTRYAPLHELELNDYKGWAKGLRKAGYATNPEYAEKLITVVERYNLSQYDLQSQSPMIVSKNTREVYEKPATSRYQTDRDRWERNKRSKKKRGKKSGLNMSLPKFGKKTSTGRRGEVFYYNRIKTVVTTKDATPKSLARKYTMPIDKFCKYNDFVEDQVIPADTKVYLQSKRNQGPFKIKTHKVKIGETIKDIAQEYGIKEDKLYKRNYLRPGQRPAPGEMIYLRGKAPRPPKLVTSFYTPNNQPRTPDHGDELPTYERPKTPAPTKPKVDVVKKVEEVETEVDHIEESYIPDDLIKEEDVETTPTIFDVEEEGIVPEVPKVVKTKPTAPKVTTPKVTVPKTTKPAVKKTVPKINSEKIVTSSTYVVQKGDTLYSISKKTGKTVEQIKKMNSLDSNVIKLGQKLIINP